jgi:hypothetical protein
VASGKGILINSSIQSETRHIGSGVGNFHFAVTTSDFYHLLPSLDLRLPRHCGWLLTPVTQFWLVTSSRCGTSFAAASEGDGLFPLLQSQHLIHDIGAS